MPLLAALIIGGIAFGAWKLLKLKGDSEKIIPDIKPRIFKIDFTKLTIALDIVIKNPTNLKLYVIKPFITLMYKGKAIVSSEVSDDIIPIEPFQPSVPFIVLIPINYLSITGVAMELIKKLQDKKTKVDFDAVVVTNIIKGVKDPVPPRVRDIKGNKILIEFSETIPMSI